jgi:lysozyme
MIIAGLGMDDGRLSAVDMAASLIRKEEGLRLEPYRDIAGNWTIGYGRRCNSEQASISVGQAEQMLADDLAGVFDGLHGLALDACQLAALASLIYNVGIGAWHQSTIKRKLHAGDIAGAADEFSRWVYVTVGSAKVISPELEARRRRECALFTRDVFGD